ncbi:MAG TPA: hypothetical protein VE760_06450 [Acidimicrobiales bacterium]|nr:hypothetical protein [Acidimicrobiales bacterium]
MSTVLVSLGVVAAAIWVVLIALSDPDQPATLARPIGRAARRREPVPTPEPAAVHTEPAPSRPALMRSRTLPASLARALWARARAAMALLVLVTFTGVVLAALVGTGLAVAVRAFTRAVR